MKKIGLALSGGGIKSISQVPVIKAILKEEVSIDMVSGTSMGSVIAALVACGLDADKLEEVVLALESEIKEKRLFSRPSAKVIPFMSKEKLIGGFVDGEELEIVMERTLRELGIYWIKDVKIPLAIPSVDVVTGKIVLFVSHPEQFKNIHPDWEIVTDISLAKAVRASCSFPFVIAACEHEGYVLVDGGIRMNLPLDPLYSYGADKTIAVTMHTNEEFRNLESLMGMAVRIMDLMRIEEDQHIIERADVHINIPLDDVWVFEVGKGMETIVQGEQVVSDHLAEIKNLTKEESLLEILKAWLNVK